ncbi:hypothetical protein D3C73_584340 [compost metagenome]
MGKMNVSSHALLAVIAEIVWDESLRKHREQHLYKEIDSALSKKDQALFLTLTSELKRIQTPLE